MYRRLSKKPLSRVESSSESRTSHYPLLSVQDQLLLRRDEQIQAFIADLAWLEGAKDDRLFPCLQRAAKALSCIGASSGRDVGT